LRLAAALAGAGRGLTALDVRHNSIGAEGVASLAQALAAGCWRPALLAAGAGAGAARDNAH
jgi:hypothetical protein